MRKILFGAAAAAAMLAPAAHADTTALVDAGYANTDYDNNNSFDAFHLGGAVQTDIASGWTMQLDGRTVLQSWDSSSGNDSQGYAALHLDTSAGNWEFGGFVGILNYYGDGGTMIGAETRTSFGDISLQGSIGYADFDEFFDYSAWNVRINGSYFISPNFAINAGINDASFDTDFTDYDVLDLSVGAGYQFSNGFEIYGDYVNTNGNPDSGSDYDADTFRIGVRYHINGGNLQDETNHGATWTSAYALHDQFLRW